MGRFQQIVFGLLAGICLYVPEMRAQDVVTLKYFGLTIHPFGDRTAALQPYKLDKKARFVMNFGGFAGYEHYVWRDLVSVKAIQGVFSDCSGGLAGISHIGVRGLLADNEKHRLMVGAGPAIMYRDSWARFGERYTPSGFFNNYHSRNLGDIQWKFFPLVMEFEYDYRVGEKTDLSVSFTPGLPMALTFSVGVKYWFRKDFEPAPVKIVRPSKREERKMKAELFDEK